MEEFSLHPAEAAMMVAAFIVMIIAFGFAGFVIVAAAIIALTSQEPGDW